MAKQHRQGHIVLDPIAAIPKNAIPVPPVGTRVVIATGESGREHLFKMGRVQAFQEDGDLFIEVTGDEPVYLEHPEHGQHEVEPGAYRVIEQREMDIGFGNPEIRRSFD